MPSADDVRRIALSLPETTEKQAWGQPTFRVKDKIFASLPADPEETTLGFAVDKNERHELIAASPKVYFVQDGHDDNYHFARLRLDVIEEEELAEVLTEAWRRIAPAKLRKAWDDN